MSLKDKSQFYFPILTACSGLVYLLIGLYITDWQMLTVYFLLVTMAFTLIVYTIATYLNSQMTQIVKHFSKFTRHLFENGQLYHRVEIKDEPLFEEFCQNYNLFLDKIEANFTDLLQSINLLNAGVLLIDSNLQIYEDYSHRSKGILGYSQIKGKFLDEIFLNGCEEKIAIMMRDRLISVFELLLPEQFMSAIKDLPKNIVYKTPLNEDRILQIDFAALTHHKSIKAILFTFTELKTTNQKSHDLWSFYQKSSHMIHCLSELFRDQFSYLEVSHSLNEFIPLSKEIHQEIKGLSINTDLNELFRKLHTIKGGVRNLRLEYLSYYAHEMEKIIASLRNKSLTIDQLNKIHFNQLAAELEEGLLDIKSFWKDDGENTTIDETLYWESYIENIKKSVKYIALDLHKKVDLVTQISQPVLGKDYSFVKKILIHLIRNAIDHGIELPLMRERHNKPEVGTITLEIEFQADRWCLRVSDDGQGIDVPFLLAKAKQRGISLPAEDTLTNDQLLDLICHPGLTSKEENEISEISGHGVGMDAVKEEIASKNGSFHILQSSSQGTTFELSWAPLSTTGIELELDEPHRYNWNVLFIDDETSMITIVKSIFKNTAIQLFTAGDLQEARQIIAEQDIAVVITDYKLETASGLQLLAYLATEFSKIQTIVVSGYLEKDFQDKALEIGVFACLSKPIQPKKLLDATLSALDRFHDLIKAPPKIN